MSDSPDDETRKKAPGLPPPPGNRARPDDTAQRKANARAVGVDTAFLDALGDEFVDAPKPSGKYGRGGTLVVKSGTGGSEPPSADADTADGDGLLFETAASQVGRRAALNLPSGRFEPVGEVPGVLAAFDSGTGAEVSDSAMVVSVDAHALEHESTAATADVEPAEADDVGDGGAGAGPKVSLPEASAVKASAAKPNEASSDKTEIGIEAARTRAGTATAAAAAPSTAATEPETDHRKIAIYVAIGILLLIGVVALTRSDASQTPDTAALVRTGDGDAGDKSGESSPGAGDAEGAPSGGADGREAAAQGNGTAGPHGDAGAEGAGAEGAGADAGSADQADNADNADNAGTGTTSAAAEAATSGSTDGDIAIVESDSGGAAGDGGGVGAAPNKPPREPDDRSAAELRQAARKAIEAREYAEAYRLAGLAQRKAPGDPALELRTEAACGMKNRGAAKKSFDKITLGKRRRDLRARCRALGIRIGI